MSVSCRIMKRFRWQNYNEFKGDVRWHDHFSIIINEFPIILIRKYEWGISGIGEYQTRLVIQILGFTIK